MAVGITNTVGMSLIKLQKRVKDREVWCTLNSNIGKQITYIKNNKLWHET